MLKPNFFCSRLHGDLFVIIEESIQKKMNLIIIVLLTVMGSEQSGVPKRGKY